MSSNKSSALKKKLAKANKKAKSAPRWVSIKAFGIERAMKKSIKPRKDRHWRRNSIE
jgi:ribosomal protein L39E